MMSKCKSVGCRAVVSIAVCPLVLVAVAAVLALVLPVAVYAQTPDSIQAAAADTVPADTIPPGLTCAREILFELEAAKDTILELASRSRTVGEEK